MRIPSFNGELKPFLGERQDDRAHLPSVYPLLVTEDGKHVVRQLTDLDGCPVRDTAQFWRRVAVLEELSLEIPSAPFTSRFVDDIGGFVVTEHIKGKSVREALHGLRDGITRRDSTQLIDPLNSVVTKLANVTTTAIDNTQPVMLDVLKSDQYCIGRNSMNPRPRLQLVDHDAHVAFADGGQYDTKTRQHLIRLSFIKAAGLGVFLAGLSKTPEIRKPNMFKPSTDAILTLGDYFSRSPVIVSDMERAVVNNVLDIVQQAVEAPDTPTVNRLGLELQSVDTVFVDYCRERSDN